MQSPSAAALVMAVMLATPSHVTGEAPHTHSRQLSSSGKSIELAKNGASTTSFAIMQESPAATSTLGSGIMPVIPPAGPSASGVGSGIMKLDPTGPGTAGTGDGIMKIKTNDGTAAFQTYAPRRDPPPASNTSQLKSPRD